MSEELRPISKTNVEVMIDTEKEDTNHAGYTLWGTPPTTPAAHTLAYDAHTLARQQTLEANNELSGDRKQDDLVPGPMNPGGQLTGHMTAETIALFYWAGLGKRVSSALTSPPSPWPITAAGYTVTVPTVSTETGLVEVGTHSYKLVVNTLTGSRSASAASAVVTVASSAKKINVPLPKLPSGWTKDLYRTVAGDTGSYKLVNTTPLGAAVTLYVDNIADASLGAAASAGDEDAQQHILTIGQMLPSFVMQRRHDYMDGTTDFFRFRGVTLGRLLVALKSTGFYDIQGDAVMSAVESAAATYDDAPSSWKSGEKIHHGMCRSVWIDDVLTGKLLDFRIDHNNNLDNTDFPMGMSGARGSAVPMKAVCGLSGTLKVTEQAAMSLVQDGALHSVKFKHDLLSWPNSVLHEFLAVRFQPQDAPVQNQGILTLAFTGTAVREPVSDEVFRVTVVNDVAGDTYDPQS